MSDEKSAGNPMTDLLAELETLAKAEAMPDDDGPETPEGNGEGGEGGEGEPDGDENGKDKGGDGDGEPMGKSFKAVINGEEKDVVDGTELVKALIGRMDSQESVMAKALTHTVETLRKQGDLLKAQAGELKALRAAWDKLAGAPAGRRSTISVHDKQSVGDMAKAQGETSKLTAGELMAKANAAAEANKITWREAHEMDVAVRLGAAPNPAVLAKALA